MKQIAAISFGLLLLIFSPGCKSDNPTESETAPAMSNPWPPSAATGITTSPTLSWSCSGSGALTYDIYFGTSTPPATTVATGQSAATLTRVGLANSTTYYWMVIAKNGSGTVATGTVWFFTTGSGVMSLNLVTVAGGTLTIGSTSATISSFRIDNYEVTYDLWNAVRTWAATHGYTDLVAGNNGYNPTGSSNPVTMVNWFDAVKWCNARSEKDGLTPVYCTDNTQNTVYRTGELNINSDAVKWSANGYRLPTETEWDFAARGGTLSGKYTYSGSSIIENVAWYSGNSATGTRSVGSKSANELGLYDMSGNVGEYCWDWYGTTYPSGSADPRGPSTTQTYRLLRGGFFLGADITCDLATRAYDADGTSHRGFINGFRCVRQ